MGVLYKSHQPPSSCSYRTCPASSWPSCSCRRRRLAFGRLSSCKVLFASLCNLDIVGANSSRLDTAAAPFAQLNTDFRCIRTHHAPPSLGQLTHRNSFPPCFRILKSCTHRTRVEAIWLDKFGTLPDFLSLVLHPMTCDQYLSHALLRVAAADVRLKASSGPGEHHSSL